MEAIVGTAPVVDMRLPPFLGALPPGLLLFGGKGGVGKTTCATATALRLARRDPEHPYLLVSTDPAHSLADSVAGSTLPANLTLLELDANERLAAFKAAHGAILKEIAARGTFLDDHDITQFLSLSLPGLDELVAFLEIAALVERRTWRTIVVDTAPWGHTLRLLQMPALVGRWLDALDALLAKHRYMKLLFSGSYRRDELDSFLLDLKAAVDRVQGALRDPFGCCFVPVALAEALGVAETADLVLELRRLQVPVTDVLVNRLFPASGCRACAAGCAQQMVEIELLRQRLGECRLWGIPLYPQEPRGADGLAGFWQGAAPLTPSEPPVREGIAVAPPMVKSPAPLPLGLTLLIFAGKGGVGKTTLACATALRLARERQNGDVFLFSTDPAHSLSACLAKPVGSAPTRVGDGLTAMAIDAQAELDALKAEYASELEEALARLLPDFDLPFDREVMERILDLSPPGLDEVMALGRATAFLACDTRQVFILDAAPTGHLLRLLEMPDLVERWLKVVFDLFLKYGKILPLSRVSERLVTLSKELKRFRALLSDPARTSICVVTNATEMAREETSDFLAACGRLGVSVPVLFVNLATSLHDCALCSALSRREAGVERQLRSLCPAAHVTVVSRGAEPRGMERLDDLGRALYGARKRRWTSGQSRRRRPSAPKIAFPSARRSTAC